MSGPSVRVVVTGTAWMGGGIGSIENAIRHLLYEAEEEIAVTAYAMSNSTDLLFEWLEAALNRGIQVKFIINNLSKQKQRAAGRLKHLAINYPHFYLYDFTENIEADLHAKAIVADRRVAIIGSSNLSRRGMLANHEISVVVKGPPAASVARVLDRLFRSKYAIRITS